MKHTKKFLALVLSLAVVASLAAAGTLAWLSDSTGNVTNKFQVATQGAVDIDLKEKITKDGGYTETGATYEGILPNADVVKAPAVSILPGSTTSYVYVRVENQFAETTAEITGWDTTNWTKIGTNTNGTIYRYNTVAPAVATGADPVKLPDVFTGVHFSSALTGETLATAIGNNQIVISAFAIQSSNVDEAAVLAALQAQFTGFVLDAGATCIPA